MADLSNYAEALIHLFGTGAFFALYTFNPTEADNRIEVVDAELQASNGYGSVTYVGVCDAETGGMRELRRWIPRLYGHFYYN